MKIASKWTSRLQGTAVQLCVGIAGLAVITNRMEEMDMKATEPTRVSEAVVHAGDDGRHAARIVMVSTGLLFGLIFLLQAIAP
jgi:F420-0:gamma-glutamyl ligase